ncbi:type II CRISPR RNA-guided endonuclease Cas9 [Ferruginibacter sp. HRS2-29]|uniref:type II CRISPR RNA-guided endonuclease Cas9 n=1 Tax=Ferruginibacter sp. HRS2-29 TaxID=2487334 RepID=UPI0020CC36D1|nr:type II CRISPR RNA-guided endonuclease Cas9 [Ferruginibacter sp. HRS2-29]MCP9752624.1 type II CRISPR RNA-guided endonuclease Cas9 [Ferruginibacter sp. HRS2-29]
MKKNILGLDLGTNSIGWALIEKDDENAYGKIVSAGSRILPMSQDILGKFDSGISISQTAERTNFRGIRRLRERHLLRRERLHRVLNILNFLPEHYAAQIDFEKKLGQFIPETEPKLPYRFEKENNKSEFLFKNSFNEMVKDFSIHQPQLLENDKLIPYDWTIYYLRKKALTDKIEKEELAWLLLHFNQKRGYYQLRGEDEEETPNKLVEFYSLKVVDVVATDDKKGDEVWYNVHLENTWIYRRTSKVFLDWIGKTKDFIVTTDINDDGSIKTDKEGKEKRSFRAPAENDWTLVKKKTEFDIDKSHKTVGTYIYDTLLQKPNQKVKGKLVRVIERKFYKAELEIILKTQQQYHIELQDKNLYQLCLEELYENNEGHRNSIGTKDFVHLFLNDIIFYQRPLKSKKSLISNCKFESRTYIKDGIKYTEPLKCIAASHPLFQEYRLWQWLQNLRIIEKETDNIVTTQFLNTEEDWANLFEWLNERKEIDNKALISYLAKPLKLKASDYRWNYVYDETNDTKKYPCNETKAQIKSRLAKCENIPTDFLTKEKEEALWHILYSVEDKFDIEKALKTFAEKNSLGDDFVENFKKFPPFKKDYGAYSSKAIKKILPLLRIGKYWDEKNFHRQTKERVEKLMSGEYDDSIRDRVREKSIQLTKIEDFSGLPQWLASYIVYDRHSEDGEIKKWKIPADIEKLEQHSLRNPIVEQVINETLQVVKSIWLQYGNGKEDFFDEIHIELGREMKNPADKRRQMTNQISENENTNLRMKAMLMELLNEGDAENVRPYSPMQQEILKLYEEGVLNGTEPVDDDILKISKQPQPSSSDLKRYILWLQQKYRSPYTGEIIPLNKLFTREYDIEHIIPQSRYFDDSLSNKVICETAVNKDKANLLGYEYIKSNYGKTIELSNGRSIKILTVDAYEKFIKEHYSKSRSKMKKLLMDEIPEAFIQRQLNDSRYISKVVKNLMSNIVRERDEQEAISKKVIASNGAITSILKQDWGLNDIWNELITPRFERLNQLTNSKNFGEWTNKEGKQVFQTQVPIELQKGFSKKRIDHRHHALDAIVIACASRNHINYLNNESALGKATKAEKDKKRYDLKHKLCTKKYNSGSTENYKWVFNKPWDTFTQDAKSTLNEIVVSFKQNLRVINKTINYYQAWKKDAEGVLIKELIKQTKGDNWAVRKPMHKDTVSGLVNLRFKKTVLLSVAVNNWQMIVDKSLRLKIKELTEHEEDKKKVLKFFKDINNMWLGSDVSKVEIFYWDKENVASRVNIDESFTSIRIKSITDTGIQAIMLNHLKKFNENKNDKIIEHPELAFNSDGLDKMNKSIQELNGGKPHYPVYKARTYEPKGNKFNVGYTGNKKDKFVEAAKGTNLFFAIYADEKGKRNYDTVPLNIAIERQKQGLLSVPEINEAGNKLVMQLSPNDLVYVPSAGESEQNVKIDFESLNKEQKKRIYKMVSSSGNQCFFIRFDIAASIVNKFEFSALNKMEKSIDNLMIKEFCIKIKVDRIGNIKSALT